MAIESTESGLLITGDSTYIAGLLSHWYAAGLSLTGLPSKLDTRRFRAMSTLCDSSKRTHAGIWVDYTIWLAGYGITPVTTMERAQRVLNKTNLKTLENGLEKARRIAAKRREAPAE